MKDRFNNLKERIKKSNIYRLINLKTEIASLNGKIADLTNEKEELIDLYNNQKRELKKRKNNDIKVATYEAIIERTDDELKKKLENNKKLTKKNKELSKEIEELQTKMFESEIEIKRLTIQTEEYQAQIEDLKSERYLVKKVRPGKTPNTNKTKISKPMSARVVKYMREEHE